MTTLSGWNSMRDFMADDGEKAFSLCYWFLDGWTIIPMPHRCPVVKLESDPPIDELKCITEQIFAAHDG